MQQSKPGCLGSSPTFPLPQRCCWGSSRHGSEKVSAQIELCSGPHSPLAFLGSWDQVKSARRWMGLSAKQETSHHRMWKLDNIENPQMLRICLKHSKTDPFSERLDIFFLKINDELYPVSALLAWLVQRKANRIAPLFLFWSGAPLMRNVFISHLKEALTNVGIDLTQFAGHSFCIGAATTAAKRGLSNSPIEQLGCWAAYQRYIQPSPTILGSLASSISTDNQGSKN